MAGTAARDAFLAAAKSFLDISSWDYAYQELCNYAGYPGYEGAWCAVYVMGCAGAAGLLGSVIGGGNAYAWGPLWASAAYYGGTLIPGYGINGGNIVIPQPGDLVTWAWEEQYYWLPNEPHASHVGIVVGVEGNQMITYEGNTDGGYSRQKYRDLDSWAVNMFMRPDWSRAGDTAVPPTGITGFGGSGSSDGGNGYPVVSGYYGNPNIPPLYSLRNDPHDMSIRQVGYMNNSYDFTNSETNIAISVINYTSLLSDLFDYFVRGVRTGSRIDTSNLFNKYTNNIKIAVDFFISNGFAASSAAGIVGCLKKYSRVEPSHSETLATNERLEGIGAWEGDKLQRLKDKLGYGWNIDLTGQLDFLLSDLLSNFSNLVVDIKGRPLTASEAEDVAEAFMWKYNKHFWYGPDVKEARNFAKEIFNTIVIAPQTMLADGKNLVDIDGNPLSPNKTVYIPGDVRQSGIDGIFTSYSYFYGRWASSSVQRTLSEIWYSSGCPYDKAIALIGGYYCVAVAPTYGTVGDVIVVALANGDTFAAIIADLKNPYDSHYCEWGHYEGNGSVNVIEWEKIVTFEGKVQTEGSSAGVVDDQYGYELGSWRGQDVVSITNYGSYL